MTGFPHQSAKAVLERLVLTQSSGELIAALDSLEVHVFLQRGRVAWATTSAERFIFRKRLVEDYQIDPELLAELIDDCYRRRRPLGETLVQARLLTPEQVRAALKAQVVASLRSLARCASGHTLFLPRDAAYSGYDAALTFSLEEVSPGAGAAPPVAFDPSAELLRLRRELPAAAWACVAAPSGTTLVTHGQPPAIVGPLARRLDAEVDVIAVRTAGETVAGRSIAGASASLWVGVPADTTFPSILQSFEGVDPLRAPLPPACGHGAFESFGETELSVQGVAETLALAGCATGLVLLEGAGAPDFWALARGPIDPCELGHVAARRQAALDAVRASSTRAAHAGPCCDGAVVADGRWWWFGRELPSTGATTAWLALPRAADTTLGFALLESLARMVVAPEGHHG